MNDLRERHDQFRVTLASIGDAVIATDIKGLVTFLNPVAEELTGWNSREAEGLPLVQVFRIINEHTREIVENPIEKVLASGNVVGLANHTILIAKNGVERPIDDSAAPIRDDNGIVTGAVLVFRDISERKQLEASLAERHKMVALRGDVSIALAKSIEPQIALQQCCQAFVLHLDVAFARVWTLNERNNLLELKASAGLYTHLDGPHSRVPVGKLKIGRIAANRVPHLSNAVAEDPEVSNQEWAKREGMKAFAGYPLLVDGRVCGVVAMFARHHLSNGILSELAPIAEWIAQYIDRRKAEDDARDAAQRLHLALHAGRMGTWEWIIGTGQVVWSTTLEAIHGLLPGSFGGTFEDFQRDIHSEDRENVLSKIRHCLERQEDHYLEYRIVKPDGKLTWIEARGKVILNEHGKPERMSGICMDITDRKSAQDALVRSEQFNRTIIESSRDCTKTLTLDGTLDWISERGQKILCVSDLWQLLGRSWIDFWKPEDRSAARAAVETAALGGVGTFTGYLKVNDEEKHWEVTITPILGQNGKPERLLAVSRDITERTKYLEATLRLAAVVESSDDAIVSKRLDGQIQTWNTGAERIFGYSATEMIGKSIFKIIPPDRVAEENIILNRLKAGERIEHFETVRLHKDGTIVDISLTVSPIKDPSGKIIGASKIAREITEQKRAEVALRHREEELRALADSIPQLAWMADTDGNIFWYNRGWYEYTGTTFEQMQGWGWKFVHDPKILPEVIERWQDSLSTGRQFEMEFPIRGADGNFRWFLTRVNPIRDTNGKVHRWFGTNTNVDEVKVIQNALIEKTNALKLLNSTGIAISSELDLPALVQTVTDAGTKLVGAQFGAFFYNVKNEKGESYLLYSLSGAPREAFEKFGLPRNTAVFDPTFRGEGIVRSNDITKDPRYGKSAPYYGMPQGHLPVRSYLAVSVISRSGEVIGGLFFGHAKPNVFDEKTEEIISGVAAQAAIAIDNARLYEAAQREIVERKRAEGVMQATKEEAERANRAKDEFLAVLSHELRTPLTSILGWIRMLRTSKPGEINHAQAFDVIERNAVTQTRLIEDLLDVSRIISGKLVLSPKVIQLPVVINSAVDAVRPAATAKGINLIWLAPILELTVVADPDRIQQVVYNLLTNAIKFTPGGGKVEVKLARLEGMIEITVTDTGIGMEPEIVPYVFDRFRQADSSITRLYQGLGIGLSIVRQVVELHGGKVRAESPGKDMGSMFSVCLPMRSVPITESDRAQPVSSPYAKRSERQ